MAYFNPITYFIKSFIRLFTRKFFWVLLILFLVFLGFLLYDKGVFAATSLDLTGEYYSNLPSNILDTVKGLDYFNTNYRCFGAYSYFSTSSGSYYGYQFIFIPSSSSYSISEIAAGNQTRFYYYNSGTTDTIYVYIIDTNGSIVLSNSFNMTTNDSWGFVNSYNNNRYYYIQNMVCTYNESNFNYSSSYIHILPSPFFAPEITNSTNDINGLTFDTLDIQLNSAAFPTNSLRTLLNVQYTAADENQFTIDISQYASSSDYTIHVPRVELIKNMVLSASFNMSFTLLYADTSGNVSNYYVLGHYNISISQDYLNTLNELAKKDTQNNIENNTDKTSKGIENLNNSIMDSNIDNITDDTLPSDDTTDITADGVNGIFTSIYNAFCTGTAQDIVFPIPFTNKNITLQANYVNNMLSSNGASWVVTIIQAFWWYLISRFIIKDVMDKINKIKSGNIEDIETTNIRGDML